MDIHTEGGGSMFPKTVVFSKRGILKVDRVQICQLCINLIPSTVHSNFRPIGAFLCTMSVFR